MATVDRKGGFRRALLRGLARVLNVYEGGIRWSRARSYIPGEVRDARIDADQATRSELVRKARYFEANSALVNRLADLFEQYTVGPFGLAIIPSSSDEEWNVLAAQWIEQWSRYPDLSSLMSWGTLQSLIARTWFVDGEVFILKTRGDKAPYYPRLQLIESHRVQTPWNLSRQEGKSIYDGVEFDGRGRPIAYHVLDGTAWDGSFRRIPADSIVHVFEPSRPGQMRGLSFLYPVMNDLHDLQDLELLEMQAAKDAAETTKVVKTTTGDAPEADWSAETTDDETGSVQYYKNVFGATTKVLGPGDTFEQFSSNRPTVTQQWYWRYLTEKVCVGVGIPLAMVMPESLQGTVYRGVLDMATAWFRARSAVLATAFSDIITYVIEQGAMIDRRIANRPADWRMFVARPPKSPNVDVGRNSSAMLAELRSGVRTLHDIYSETGDDWKTKVRQRANEIAYIRKVAESAGVPASELSDLIASESAQKQEEKK